MSRNYQAVRRHLLLILAPILGAAAESPVGLYRSANGPDMASRLQLGADGHFRYEMAYGALDERAEGTWRYEKDAIRLTTEPKPKPAEFIADSMTADGEAPLSFTVSWPNGEGIAGVDFRIGFDSGEPAEGYTQYHGWQRDPADKRHPQWIELYEPIHGVGPKRFAITDSKANLLRFTLVPNDIGIADFRGTKVTVEGDKLVLHHKNGDLRYVRERE